MLLLLAPVSIEVSCCSTAIDVLRELQHTFILLAICSCPWFCAEEEYSVLSSPSLFIRCAAFWRCFAALDAQPQYRGMFAGIPRSIAGGC